MYFKMKGKDNHMDSTMNYLVFLNKILFNLLEISKKNKYTLRIFVILF